MILFFSRFAEIINLLIYYLQINPVAEPFPDKKQVAYHFSNKEYISIIWLIKKICSLTHKNFGKSVKIARDRPSKDYAYKMKPTKAEKELNWKPKYTIEKGLKATIQWYKANKKQLSDLKNIYVHKK